LMERSLILACGNTLRGDDGVGSRIAGQLEQDASLSGLEIHLSQQLLPEMSEPVSRVDLVIFVDCSAVLDAGIVSVQRVKPAPGLPRIFTHHLDPSSILRMAIEYYGCCAPEAFAVTVGGSDFSLSEDLSEIVALAIPSAVLAVKGLLLSARSSKSVDSGIGCEQLGPHI
jgi:hydrogenase maturation protease